LSSDWWQKNPVKTLVTSMQADPPSAGRSSAKLPPDFAREVRCVLGLPFDAVSAAQAEQIMRLSITQHKTATPSQPAKRCFFSTPNLNFATACMSDADFRASVLQSDLSLADGWPIVALSQLMGSALPERVSGSTLFEQLEASAQRPPMTVYFFGGPDGAAQAASARINQNAAGVRCVGFAAPGFGSVLDMSHADHLNPLNAAQPDFVVVAIGAKKGQAWIQANLVRITAPVVSYLGAVVNFTAGTVARAPQWAQAAKLEWLWRIKEEPALWRRYAADGWMLLRLLLTRVIPGAAYNRLRAPSAAALSRASAVLEQPQGKHAVLRLSGAWAHHNLSALRERLAQHAATQSAVALDLAAVSHLDSSAIALLSLLHGWQLKIGAGWEVTNASAAAQTTLRLACADYLLQPFHPIL
jgi:N-acetylglucosaminyldiphosphoundecaprenol N-acetyl-beta-D-mannosaminyltransferase